MSDARTASPRSPLSVLVIEDNEVNQEILQSMLDVLGHRCVLARDGAEGLSLFRAGGFDLVLVDWLMPVMDGLAATRAMRAAEAAMPTARRTPIVVVSASAMVNEVDHCIAAGADAHLAKPFRKVQLDEVIRRVVVAG